MKIINWLLVFLSSFSALSARYQFIRHEQDLDKLVNQYQYSVVCFASDERGDKNAKYQLSRLVEYMKDAAKNSDYKKYMNKDLGFLVVDSDRVSNDVGPVCFLFRQGAKISTSKLQNPKSQYDIVHFMNEKFKSELDKIIQDRKENERLERQERIALYYSNPYGYWAGPYWAWGYGYPYGRWGYPYGGVGFGYW